MGNPVILRISVTENMGFVQIRAANIDLPEADETMFKFLKLSFGLPTLWAGPKDNFNKHGYGGQWLPQD
jgi:hypothetical protein